MKKISFLICSAVLFISILTGCAGADVSDKALKIVCTNFPAYDFVMNIIGEKSTEIEVVYLLEKGVDMHNYQASAEAITQIMSADLVVYVGGESEEWVEDVLDNTDSKELVTVKFMDVVELEEEVIKEGMEHDHSEHGHHANKVSYDEHVWLSLKNAVRILETLETALVNIDADNKDFYCENADSYKAKIVALDDEFAKITTLADGKVLIVADRFPFLYMAKDYGIEYYAAFPGCSAESEAGFETITFLAEKVKAYNVSTVFQIETSDGSLVETVINASGVQNVKRGILDSMQSVSKEKIDDGYSYFSAMQYNLESLREALE